MLNILTELPKTRRLREKQAYQNAKDRCNNPKNPGYKHYGGRGIEFRFASFEEFYAELGDRPEGMTLDRIDNDGHYAPNNVRWITQRQQTNNRRGNVRIKIGLQEKTLSEWVGGSRTKKYKKARYRLKRGWCGGCAIALQYCGNCSFVLRKPFSAPKKPFNIDDPKTDEGFGKLMAAAREKAGLKQKDVAKILNLSQKGISDRERGRTGFTAAEVTQLQSALGTNLFLMDDKSIGKLVQDARKDAGLSQSDVGEIIHLSRRSVSDRETGRTGFRAAEVVQLRSVLEINLFD